MADQIISFRGNKTRRKYPEKIRRVFYDKERNRTFVIYTNNMKATAEMATSLYKNRWRVEHFFQMDETTS